MRTILSRPFIYTKNVRYLVFDVFGSLGAFGVCFLAYHVLNVYGMLFTLFIIILAITWFGYEHSLRQLFFSFLFVFLFWVTIVFYGDAHFFLIMTQTMVIICLSLGIYFSMRTNRETHRRLNKSYVLQKNRWEEFKTKRREQQHMLEGHEHDFRMMSAIYETTKRMVAAMTLEDILHICMSFFNRYFLLSSYLIFQYNRVQKIYTKLHSSGMSDMMWERFHMVLEIEKMLHSQKGHKVINRDSDDWTLFSQRIPNDVKSVMIMPLIAYGERMNGAVLFSTDENYFSEDIIKYLMVFSRQMALGIEKVILYEDIREKSQRDSLTKLFTRTYWDERFEHEIKKAKRYGSSFAILMIDIDFFKKYNDKYGHLVGDEVLKKITRLFGEHVRETDIIARYGGEEFVILMHAAERSEVYTKAQQIRRSIEKKQFFTDGADGLATEQVTVSIGIAWYPVDGISKKELVGKADKALYNAKRTGRNRVVDYHFFKGHINSKDSSSEESALVET